VKHAGLCRIIPAREATLLNVRNASPTLYKLHSA
jgi:hypothetical protein